MKKISFQFLAIVAIGLIFVGLESKAADTVTASVTAQNVAVSLNQTTFDYGIIPTGQSSSTLALFSGAGISATNDGNVNADFTIYGANTTDWTLGGTAGENIYVHSFCDDTESDCSTPTTNYSALTISPATFELGVAPAASQAFQLNITTPSSTTFYTQQSAAVTIQVSASS